MSSPNHMEPHPLPTVNEWVVTLTHPADRILDLHPGNGALLNHLKSLGYQSLNGIVAADDETSHSGAEGIFMHIGRLPNLPFPDEKLDVVIADAVLHQSVQRRNFMAEVRRVLRPGGQALITVPAGHAKYAEPDLHWFLGRFFDVLGMTQVQASDGASNCLAATCQRVERTAGFWDLVSRREKF